jgi:hypothetical protein
VKLLGGIMQAALRVMTKVLPGNKVELDIPEGAIGEEIEIIIMLPEPRKPRKRRGLEILEAAHQLGEFRSVEEVERDLRSERDAWDD